MTTAETEPPLYSRWQFALVIAALVAMGLHFVLAQNRDMPLLTLITIGGIPLVIRIAIKTLKGEWGADLLGGIELVAAAILEQYLAAALIILMLAGGQALEIYAVRRASTALRLLAARMPARAHRKIGEHIEDIAISDIAIADTMVIYPHETAPVDGIVIEGHGSMDESYLTGEPYLVSKAPGVAVLSGAVNGEAALTIRAEKLPQDSRYARIMQVMEQAEQERPRLRRLGDRLGAAFAVFALVVACLAWLITGDALRFLSVLVIATPCPLIIAIPVTIIGAISLAARHGIVIKDPGVLERLPTCRTAIFDKTGTLTYGKPELTEIIPLGTMSRDALLQVTASLERYSKHPLSSAILKKAQQEKIAFKEAVRVSEKPGQGLTGQIDGQEIIISHRKKLAQAIVAGLPPAQPGMECVVLAAGMPAGIFSFRDAPRAEGRSFINHLAPAHQFTKVMLVSGDRASEVEYLAKQIGITDTHASQSPEQKVAIVQAENSKAPTLFMGDGINDAPALAVATVGIAFGGQSVTAEAAGAVILENTLAKVDELIHISARFRAIALQSAIGGIVVSLIGMGFAALGHITPVQGALLQEAIDVLAIMNALRLTWQPKVEADIK